ncbi:hypothetical protein SDC9_136042 [bioreactor metagenome]|uniref:Uncharacterized protein n=1 Tax=bioreactor metagenome TaxID=1076179 RepID=A0A645DIT6_9ZZZZ
MRGDRGDDDDERSSRPADLDPAAAEERDQESRRDRGVEAPLRRQAAGNGERHGQRQRHHADGDPRKQVRLKGLQIITLQIGK